jgi:hypothetical protein
MGDAKVSESENERKTLVITSKLVFALLLFAAPVYAIPDTTPQPKIKLTTETPSGYILPSGFGGPAKPAARRRITFDTGWLARAHWTAAAFDEATTGMAVKACGTASYCHERNPLARPLIGSGRNNARLAMGFALESAAVSFIPNRKLRRITQIAAIGLHIYFGTKNIKTWK